MPEKRRVLNLVLLSCLVCCWSSGGTAGGQAPNRHPSSGTPGLWYNGRFFGYSPTHLQTEPRRLGREGQPRDVGRKTPAANAHDAPERWAALQAGTEGAQQEEPPQVNWDVGSDLATAEPASCDLAAPEGAGCCGVPCIWGRAEYLLWWTQGVHVPALATTSPNGTPREQAGVLGQPGTSVLFGGTELCDESRSGGRFTLGLWLDPCQSHGVEVTYLTVADETEDFFGSIADHAILARPFLSTRGNEQDARQIVFPDLVAGTMAIEATTELQLLEVLFRRAVARTCGLQIDLLLGYRYAELEDLVRVDEFTLSLAGATEGSTIDLFDQFDAKNRFHGGELGVQILRPINACWSLDFVAKIALGSTRSRVAIAGQRTSTTTGGDSDTVESGLLAQPTNIGSFEHDEFSTISEFGVSLRRQLLDHLTATVGYTFLYWTDIARAGDQIDLGINTTQIPPGSLVGEARPAFTFDKTDFWAQGLHFGLEYSF